MYWTSAPIRENGRQQDADMRPAEQPPAARLAATPTPPPIERESAHQNHDGFPRQAKNRHDGRKDTPQQGKQSGELKYLDQHERHQHIGNDAGLYRHSSLSWRQRQTHQQSS